MKTDTVRLAVGRTGRYPNFHQTLGPVDRQKETRYSVRWGWLAIIVLASYVVWGFFGLDITIQGPGHRLPVHRAYMLLTLLLSVANIGLVLHAITKNKLLLALLVFSSMTSIWADDYISVIKNFTFCLAALMICILVAPALLRDEKSVPRFFFWVTFFMTAASVLVALKAPQYGVDTVNFGRPRWIGITSHPNRLGALSLILVWSSVNLFFVSSSKYEKLLCGLALSVAFYALIGANSLTSMAASVFGVLYVTYLYVLGKQSIPLKIAFVVTSVMLLVGASVTIISPDRAIDASLVALGRDRSLSGRTMIWEDASKAIAQNIIFGSGFDELDELSKQAGMRLSHLHDGYIEVLVKGGAVGLGLLVSVILMTLLGQLYCRNSNYKYYVTLNSGLAVLLIHNLAESSMLRGLNPLWVIFIFIVVSTNTICTKTLRPS